MGILCYVLALVTSLTGFLVAIYTFYKIYHGTREIKYYLYCIVFIFFHVPVVMQLLYPDYRYPIFRMANAAMSNDTANIIYYLFLISFTFAIISIKENQGYGIIKVTNMLIINVATVAIIGILILAMIQNGISVLFLNGYGALYFKQATVSFNQSLLCAGIIFYLIVLASKEKISKKRLVLLTLIMLSFIWIEGKRFIVAETVVMILFVLAITGAMSGKRILRYGIVAGVVIFSFLLWYQEVLKQKSTSAIDYLFTDLSRQYTLVYQIFCNLKGKSISLGKYDAIVYILTSWLPRTVWPAKPYPFVNSLTMSLLGGSTVHQSLGWAATCSIFSDLFDSFNYGGFVIGIIGIRWLIKKASKTTKIYYKILLVYFIERLLTTQFTTVIFPVGLVSVTIYVCDKIGKKQIGME